ncbi:MAG: 50S ribosomal protein L14 [archaeon]
MVKRVSKVHAKPIAVAPKYLPIGARLVCADNSGARIVEIISVHGHKGRHRRIASAGVGDMVNCTVKKGNQDLRGEVFQAIVIRQKKEYKRVDGTRIKFEDNAAVLTTADGDLKGTEIKGPVAKEAATKWPGISGAGALLA